ncbi:MAG: hypothetical protein ACE5HC_09965 [Candidatus Binatia bacterium]
MPIWQLTPIDKASDHWQASTHKGEVIVRAASEGEARAKATAEFIIATRKVPGRETLFSPWKQPNLVSCQRLEHSKYEEKGPVAVLDPNT